MATDIGEEKTFNIATASDTNQDPLNKLAACGISTGTTMTRGKVQR